MGNDGAGALLSGMAVLAPISDQRAGMIEHYLPLARRLARRYAHGPDQLDELTQVASLALIGAVDRFDPERGTSFAAFAIPTILGELKRHFRDTSWAVRVPRDLQERALKVRRVADQLTETLGRSPRLPELAEAAGLSEEEVIEAREVSLVRQADSFETVSLAGREESASWEDLIGRDERGYDQVDARASVVPAVAALPRRQQAALRLRFVDDLSQSEIGRRLGVSQMQVSRLLRTALEVVRRELAA